MLTLQQPQSSEVNQDVRSSLGRGLPVRITTPTLQIFGVIQDVMQNGVSILAKQDFAEGTSISVEFGSAKLEGRVASCRAKRNRYEICVEISSARQGDLRAARRFPLSEAVQVCTADSESRVSGLITDLSANGIGLEFPHSLDVGETVTIESEFHVAFGVVRHCSSLPQGGYHAGLEVFHIMPREPAHPKHPHKVSVLEGLFPDFS